MTTETNDALQELALAVKGLASRLKKDNYSPGTCDEIETVFKTADDLIDALQSEPI